MLLNKDSKKYMYLDVTIFVLHRHPIKETQRAKIKLKQ